MNKENTIIMFNTLLLLLMLNVPCIYRKVFTDYKKKRYDYYNSMTNQLQLSEFK